jgi:predicted component of type VI protein secretion system
MNGADRAFFEPLIRQWNEILHPGKDQQDTGYKALPRCEFLMRVAVGMHESMGLRDSLILSVISQLTPSELIEAAVNPTQPDTAQLVSSTLSAVFRDSTQRPDQEVCGRCLDTLVEIHSRVPRTYCVQPLAVMAYLLWWSGRDEEAGGAALRALSIDGECTLASIVLTATEYGISPAWKGRGKK